MISPETSSTPPSIRQGSFALGDLRRFGPASQSAVAGMYAWTVTVAPLAWNAGAPRGTLALSLLAPLALLAAIAVEATRPRLALAASVWGALLPSVAVWLRTSETIAAQLDAARGVLGFFGWAAFAFVAAAPPIGQAHVDAKRSEHEPTFVPRVARSRVGNVTALVVAAVACGVLQWPRTDGGSVEREVFVRVGAIAASLLVAARAGDIVSSASRKVSAARVVGRVLPALLVLLVWSVLGVVSYLFLG